MLTGLERAKSRIITSGLGDTAAKNPFLLSKAEERAARKKQMELRDGLTVPRRYVCHFTASLPRLLITADQNGRERPQDWSWRGRRETLSSTGDGPSHSQSLYPISKIPELIYRLAESSSLLMTPFERNLQLWRQLWRVIERSHLIVQIVDARNPMGFRCVDLENYVSEVGSEDNDGAVPGKGQRRSLLLINKADLLTIEQRYVYHEGCRR